MKKFQFAAGLMAMGLLASCSSDAPDMPNNGGNAANEGEMIVALRISTADVTRADDSNPAEDYDNVKGSDSENNIKDMTLQVLVNNAPVMTFTTGDTFDTEKGLAYFNVKSAEFNTLKNTYGGQDVTLRLYANATCNGLTPQTTSEDYLLQTFSGDTWTENQFMMTNNEANEAKLSAMAEGQDGKSKETAWLLNSGKPIVLERLATRFDLIAGEGKTDLVYNMKDDDSITMTIEGVAVRTHSNSTFLFRQANQTTPLSTKYDWSTPQMATEFTGSTPYLKAIGGSIYGRPRKSDVVNITYASAAYAVVKVSFESDKFGKIEGDEDTNTLYAYNGVLLGTYKDFESKSFTYPASIESWVNLMIKDIDNETLTPEKLAKTPGVTVYKKEGEKFYTYYSRILTHEALGADGKYTAENTRIIRNHIYEISVNSFARLGLPGENPPTDVDDDETLWIDLSVQIKNWILNNANTGWEF